MRTCRFSLLSLLVAGPIIALQLTGCASHSSFLSQPELSQDEFLQRFADGVGDKTRLAPDYIYEKLKSEDLSTAIKSAYAAHRLEKTEVSEDALVRALELDFILSPETSSLDLLNPELSEHFRGFDWQENDYPGGAEGENEVLADIMVDALDIVSPERRANRSRTAVLLRDEVTDEIWEYLLGQWTPVPGEGDWKLNRHAVDSYVRMRAAAESDGVTMSILSGHRDPKRAAASAKRAANQYAVASFSSHSLGVAIDFNLPRAESEERFRLSTKPMSEVVAMRESPVHKWLHLYGYQYGWYPFQHEPWHWEYNPPGFRDTFWADFQGEVPAR